MEKNELETTELVCQEGNGEAPCLQNLSESDIEDDCDQSYVAEGGVCVIHCG